MDKVFSDPRVRDTFKMLEARLAGVVPSGKIQLGILRAFKKLSASEKSLVFNLGDKSPVIPGVDMLMQDDRVAIVVTQALGIYTVPVTVTGTGAAAVRIEDRANGRYISCLNSGVFSAAEAKSLAPFFNAKVEFKTDQTTRYDAMSSSMFQDFKEQAKEGEIQYSLKHLFLPTYPPVVGGKVNTITLTMPSDAIITDIAGTATQQHYGVLESAVFYLVGGDRDAIMGTLFS
jgi:hypothetical protein